MADDYLKLTFEEGNIAILSLNRPKKSNAINMDLFRALHKAAAAINNSEARVVILTGAGKNFCGGIDLQIFSSLLGGGETCEARKRMGLLSVIKEMQDGCGAPEHIRVPVIAAVQGACIGAGIDLISSCDVVFASSDAFFSIKEVDLGITADLGTLQRLPRRGIPLGIVRELAYTARRFDAAEAQRIGLVNAVFNTQDELLNHVRKIAKEIAARSPLAVYGSKQVITHARDHTVQEGLDYVAMWNTAYVLSADATEAITAQLSKRPAQFAKL